MDLPFSALDRLTIPRGSVDLERGLVTRGDAAFALTPLESKLLRFLAEQSGAVVPKDRLLQEVWGYSASVQSRAVDKSIHRLRQKLEEDADSPQVLITVAGEGLKLRLSSPLGAAQTRALFQPPPRFEPWIGDPATLKGIQSAVQPDGAWVTLVGPGGAGKTRLAVEIAATSTGALFVDLTTARKVSDVISVFARELGCVIGPDTEDVILAWLQKESPLVVLDNVEQLLPEFETTLSEWRGRAPSVRWLATSRKPVGVIGERRVEVPLLTLEQSKALFAFRVAAQGGEPPATMVLDQLLDRLEGLPLAIELAAARQQSVPVEEMLVRWDEADRWLAQGRRPGPERHRGLVQAISWSVDLLTPEQQLCLQSVAVFCEAFDLRLLEAFWELPKDECLDTLEILVENHLVRPNGDGMFRLHPVLKAALLRRMGDEERKRAISRHSHAFAACVRRVPKHHPRWSQARADLTLAVETSVREERFAEAMLILRVLGEVYWNGGPLSEGVAVVSRWRGAVQRQSPRDVTDEFLYFESYFYLEIGQPEHGAALLSGVGRENPYQRLFEVRVLLSDGRVRQAFDILATLRADPDDEWYPSRQWMQATCLIAQSDYEPALRCLSELHTRCREAGDLSLLGLVLAQLGQVHLRRHQEDEALTMFESALEIHQHMRSLLGEASCWQGVAIVHSRKGDFAQAKEIFSRTLGICRRGGLRRLEAGAHANLGRTQHRLGDLEGAAAELEQSIAMFRSLGSREAIGASLWNLARVRYEQGHREVGRALAQEVLDEHSESTPSNMVEGAREALQTW